MKINSKWIKNLYVICKTIKLLEDNIWENPDDLCIGNDCLDTTAKAWFMKKIITWTSLKSELLLWNINVKRMKREAPDWEKILRKEDLIKNSELRVRKSHCLNQSHISPGRGQGGSPIQLPPLLLKSYCVVPTALVPPVPTKSRDCTSFAAPISVWSLQLAVAPVKPLAVPKSRYFSRLWQEGCHPCSPGRHS